MTTGTHHLVPNPHVNRNGTARWFDSAGNLHREDGPAVMYEDGTEKWYINGRQLIGQEIQDQIRKKEIKRDIIAQINNRIPLGLLDELT